MGRSSITDEARNRTQDQAESSGADVDDADAEESTERVQVTYRTTEEFRDRIDDAADELGITSRNDAITHMLKQYMRDHQLATDD